MLIRTRPLFLLLIISASLLAGCRNSNQATRLDSLQIGLVAPVFPPAVGAGTVKVQVADTDGKPINNLNLNIKGDMAHAGMAPELADVSTSENGIYSVPFEWTMAGDWVITVNVESEQGDLTQRRFHLSVDGDLPVCGVDAPAALTGTLKGAKSEE